MNLLLWGVLPYLAIGLLVGGAIWRYRYDKFGWTTRSSQLYESRLLRIGSPLFHFGLLLVVGGHIMGLVIPESWTAKAGISEHGYHLTAVVLGGIAGVATLAGITILIFRRRTVRSVFATTTKNDKLMYVVLVLALVAGLATTVLANGSGDGYNYRATVAPWFRSLFILQPRIADMAAVPFAFKLHTLIGMALFAIWPFTRLIHAFAAPVQYLFRPYLVYRSRDDKTGLRPARPGWDR